MKRIQIITTILLSIYSTPLYANHLLSKLTQISKLVPPSHSQVHQNLRSVAMKKLVFQNDPTQQPNPQLARMGIEVMAKESVLISLKRHGVFDQKFRWQSQILTQLNESSKSETRCQSCKEGCPRGLPCSTIPVSMKIRNILTYLPPDQSELSQELAETLQKYKDEIREIVFTPSLERLKTYATIAFDSELSKQLESLLKNDPLLQGDSGLLVDILNILQDTESS